MSALVKPIGIGLLGFVLSVAVLRFGFSLLPFPAAGIVLAQYPGTLTLLPLLFAGYLAARYAVSRYGNRRVMVGALAGALSYLLILVTSGAQVPAWIFVLLILVAAVWSALGGLIGVWASSKSAGN